MTKPNIYILHENEVWVEPLAEALEKRGLNPVFKFLDQGMVPLHEEPPLGVYYNRVSASSYTRDHHHSPQYTKQLISWLESHGRRVINDNRALGLELDKLAQYRALQKAGVKTPKTIAALGREAVKQAAQALDSLPFILKPNCGGKGAGVTLIQDFEELDQYLNSEAYEEPVDGIWLVQEYIRSPERRIIRCEFVDSRFLYAVSVDTSRGFDLCPADACNLNLSVPKFRITHELDDHPIINAYERFLNQQGVEIAGIELVIDEMGQIYTYDVNTNTNYNSDAEKAAGLSLGGMEAVAQFLHQELDMVVQAETYELALVG